MKDRKREENFYDLLKVDTRATVAEIVTAYHSAKNAFAKDSVATYSLFSSEEAEAVLKQLEEAYLTLSNLERRVEYDRRLTQPEGTIESTLKASLSEQMPKELVQSPVASQAAPTPVTAMSETSAISAETPMTPTSEGNVVSIDVGNHPPTAVTPEPSRTDECSGTQLREMRAQRGLSMEDVARITKIPSKFLRTIEEDDFKRLPARVYIQGFIKNLAVLYKVDPKTTAKGYLTYLDRVAPSV